MNNAANCNRDFIPITAYECVLKSIHTLWESTVKKGYEVDPFLVEEIQEELFLLEEAISYESSFRQCRKKEILRTCQTLLEDVLRQSFYKNPSLRSISPVSYGEETSKTEPLTSSNPRRRGVLRIEASLMSQKPTLKLIK